ncbi:MAG: CBS domain-containing protein [Spirochaetales bacterium]|nr:CBS domain-containing protein [Spirochaetales bacterium]
MQYIPISTYNSPTVILELIYRLKVKDVMSRNLMTAGKNTSLRSIQKSMKESSVTGIPIIEGKRLLGIISMDDIIQAFDGGYIDEPAMKHMSRNLIVLEDDMPVSFAISYFDKHKYRRFPVLNKEKELVGMVTSRDITTRLLVEINTEVARIERVSSSQEPAGELKRETKTFKVIRHDFENAGFASMEIKKYLKKNTIAPKVIRRIAIAAYELEMNLVVHSNGGEIIAVFETDRVNISAKDSGPGIPDVDLALQEGYSTANEWIRSLGFGAGMGLPNVRNVSDDFSIKSSMENGTEVNAAIQFSIT